MSSSLGCRKKMAKNLAASAGTNAVEAGKVIEKVLSMITETIVKENRVELRNFGVFECVEKPPRKCRNPRTGGVVFIPKKYKIKFKPSKKMILKILENKTSIK